MTCSGACYGGRLMEVTMSSSKGKLFRQNAAPESAPEWARHYARTLAPCGGGPPLTPLGALALAAAVATALVVVAIPWL